MRKQINYAFLLAMGLNAFLWWSGISLIGSSIKTFGDCGKEYKIDKYVSTNWFCPMDNDQSTKEFFQNFNKPKHKRG